MTGANDEDDQLLIMNFIHHRIVAHALQFPNRELDLLDYARLLQASVANSTKLRPLTGITSIM